MHESPSELRFLCTNEAVFVIAVTTCVIRTDSVKNHQFRQPKKTGRNETKATKKCAQQKNSVRHSRYMYELAADLSRKFSLHRKPRPG